ncbi:hypothetical protein BIW53_04000 [Pseudoalteromonas byunsanensis]|uniref:Uncharacterized protein n=3 Tax=Pseudoalteromonas byunsanensis TaxID=327939 RepID=A0A1S1N9Z3_9GAMM|nr:hypothetical protein BIW53_04000 [Pseudoalteromonas byunsanensis]
MLVSTLMLGCASSGNEPMELTTTNYDDDSYARRIMRGININNLDDKEVPKDAMQQVIGHGGSWALFSYANGSSGSSAALTGIAGYLLEPEDRASRISMIGLAEVDKGQPATQKDVAGMFDEELRQLYIAMYDLPSEKISAIEPTSFNEYFSFQGRTFLVKDNEYCENRLDIAIKGKTLKGPGIWIKKTADERYQKLKEDYDAYYKKEMEKYGGCLISILVSTKNSTRVSGEQYPWLNKDKDYITAHFDYLMMPNEILTKAIIDSKVKSLYIYTPAVSYSVGKEFEKMESLAYPTVTSNYGQFLFVKPKL